MSDTTFDHISLAHKDEAVRGFVKINPSYAGIDFDTMMGLIFDADAHLPIIGDVLINEAEATALVRHFIDIARITDYLAEDERTDLCECGADADDVNGHSEGCPQSNAGES